MLHHKYISGIVLLLIIVIGFYSCTDKKEPVKENSFTRIDSLTERYLELQDSLLLTWNIMVHDDDHKIKAMHNLLHELMVSNQYSKENLMMLEQRLGQLERMRYDQKTMAEAEVIEEYDFASNSLVSELVSLAESLSDFPQRPVLQNLVDEIKSAEQRLEIYRSDYDNIAKKYNQFLEANKKDMKEIDKNISLERKPLFEDALSEN